MIVELTWPIRDFPNPNRDRRLHWAQQRKREGAIRQAVGALAWKATRDIGGQLATPVTVSFTIGFPDNRERDLENWSSKGFLDGIVDGGLLPGDSSRHIVKVERVEGERSPKGHITMTARIQTAGEFPCE